MLTIKVIWPYNNFTNYNVYAAKQYGVYGLSDGTTQLLIDSGAHDIRLSKGSTTYVMNDYGATVDTITVTSDTVAPISSN